MHQTNGADNFLRTPTKGGASAYNSTSSMNSTSKTQYTSKTKLEPVISPPLAPTQSASLLNKHQSSPVKTSELREAAEEMYSFDEDSSENYDVFKAKKAKTTSKSFDFNLKCIYAENNGPMSVDERDLVSKRLKETLLKNEQYTKNVSILILTTIVFQINVTNSKKIEFLAIFSLFFDNFCRNFQHFHYFFM